MTITLLVISDGRDDYLQQTLISAGRMLPEFDEQIWIDDRHHKLGFAGAIQKAWNEITTDYVFHLEQDFTFNEPIDVKAIIETLQANPYLAQLALLRQPWNDEERAAGGIVQLHPESYELVGWKDNYWLEHTRFFTTNPSIYPRWIVDRGWPQRPHSEGHFSLDLFDSDPNIRCGFWGARELVTHIGAERAGVGY